jgi:nitroreductase
VYIVLLAAHARGLASYWRTPRVLQSREGQAAVGMGEDEQFVALIHLGAPVDEPEAKERAPVTEYVTYLD